MADQIDINLGGLKLITCDRSFTRDVALLIQTFENSNFVVKLTLPGSGIPVMDPN